MKKEVGGALLWPFAMVIPISIAMGIYGIIPLGSPARFFSINGQWPMIFIVTPLVMTTISYLNVRIYSASKNERKRIGIPISHLMAILIATYFFEVLILSLVVSLKGNIDLLGLVALGVSYVVTYLGIFFSEIFTTATTTATTTTTTTTTGATTMRIFWTYVKMGIVMFVYFLWLNVFIVVYREARWISYVQPLLNFSLAIVVFIFKKVLLRVTDPFPVETAMLISSLWIQNLNDIFQTLAYPSIVNPIIYAYIWGIHFLANIANLVFLTKRWFRLRLWIKGIFKGYWRHSPKAVEEDDPLDHGHSWNRPGYLRRQMRFFFWRIFSAMWAIVFYVCMTGILRFGPNSPYYPFSSSPYLLPEDSDQRNVFTLDWTDYGNSLIFVAVDWLAVLFAGILGLIFIKRNFNDQLKNILLWRGSHKRHVPLADLEDGKQTQQAQHAQHHDDEGEESLREKVDEKKAEGQQQPQPEEEPLPQPPQPEPPMGVGRYVELVVCMLAYNGLVSVMILQYHLKIWWAFESEAEKDVQ